MIKLYIGDLQPIELAYPELIGQKNFYGPSDYNPLLKSLGFEILIQIDDNDYQGDSRLLLKNQEKIGYLQFGWGSCSGCDALQACKSMNDITQLREELFNQIKWFNNKEEALTYFETHDWKGDYSNNQKEQKEFIEKTIEYLKEI